MENKVSIILPVYNVENYLRETLDTIVAQTFTNLEIICINDGSTDSSGEILREYAERDTRFIIEDQANAGPAAARNRGLDMATGEFVMMLDADDLYDPELIRTAHDRAVQTRCDMIVVRSMEFDDEDNKITLKRAGAKVEQVPQKDPFTWRDMGGFVFTAFIGWPWDKFYRRSLIEDAGLRFPALQNSEDLYFVFLSLVKAASISFIEEPLIKHRTNRATSLSNSRESSPTAFYDAICLLKEKLEEEPQDWADQKWGFLNWAMDFTLWNIEYMPPGEARRALIERLFSDNFPALEMATHGIYYYSLCSRCPERFRYLSDEYIDGSTVRISDSKPKAWLEYIGNFITDAGMFGFRHAFHNFGKWVKRKRGRENAKYHRARGRWLPFEEIDGHTQLQDEGFIS